MNLNEINLLSLQPSYLQQDKFVQALCKAINPYFNKLGDNTKLVYIYGRIDELEEEVIDSLAWQFHVDFYDYTLSLHQKRELVKKSKRLHRIKGTPTSVEEACTTIFGRTKLREWFEYGGNPYFFSLDIDITDRGTSPEELVKLDNLINAYKNKRSWLEKINIFLTVKGNIHFASYMSTGEEITVYPWTANNIESTGNIEIALAQNAGLETITTYPKEG